MTCAGTELRILHQQFQESAEAHWVYTVPVHTQCPKCKLTGIESRYSLWRRTFPMAVHMCCPEIKVAQIPIPTKTVGVVERAIHAASTAEKGGEGRAHATFIHHLSNLDVNEEYKQSLCAWAPAAMGGYMSDKPGVRRKLHQAKPKVSSTPKSQGDISNDSPKTIDQESSKGEPEWREPPGLEKEQSMPPLEEHVPNVDPVDEQTTFRGNPDVEDGAMLGTQLNGDEYGEEDRVKHDEIFGGQTKEQVLAHAIGPDLLPTETMQSTIGNLKAGLAKRVKPLPFKAPTEMKLKIEKLVTALITQVFSAKKIRKWREENPVFSEMKSKKWSAQRFREAYTHCLSDIEWEIEQEFQIKNNEALPSKGKAPRPIIQTGDKGQIAMLLPVKCFESLLFAHFKDASIKGKSKHEAMCHFAKYMHIEGSGKNVPVNAVEGDGSAWDSCCTPEMRAMTENRIMEHIVEVLGEDAEVPAGWMSKVLKDMNKPELRGKAKVADGKINAKYKTTVRIKIQAIRQSGHRGTSAFNWLINYVGWMVVLCEEPERMVKKDPKGELPKWYQSSRDWMWYQVKYKFEGDDSALVTTEPIQPHSDEIEQDWEYMGFRMKLIFGSNKLAFTGFNFAIDKFGPTGAFCPEIARNIASSSWTTSSEAKSNPKMVSKIGAAAMMARAENFAMCGPFSKYFAELGLAHSRISGDFGIDGDEAMRLGIRPADSIVERLHELAASASAMTADMRSLVKSDIGEFTVDQEAKLLSCYFGSNPFDTPKAAQVVPRQLWDPAGFKPARR